MVDLVKIRKKKARKAQEEAEAAAEAAAAAAGQAAPASGEVAGSSSASSGEPAEPQENLEARPTGPEESPRPAGAIDKLARFKEQAGKRRDEQAVQAVATETGQLELLTYVIAGEQYAVDIERIVEIVTPRPVTRIPNADPSVVGIISLRGTIVTLVDVRRRLHHPPAGEPNAETRIVVVDFHNETVGFIVDRVLRVVKTAPGEVEPPPIVHASELDESVRGVFRVNGALTILLDLDKLLDSRALAATVA